MDYYAASIILGILFWVLFAIAVAGFIVWVFIYAQYYKWDKDEKSQSFIVQNIEDKIKEKMKEVKDPNSGGNCQS